MAHPQRTVRLVLASPVANGGTFTVNYPPGTNRGDFVRGVKHRMSALQNLYVAPEGLGAALGASSATVTYRGATTLPAGTEVWFEFDTGAASFREGPDSGLPPRTEVLHPVLVNLGNPVAGAANSISTTQAVAAATVTGALLNGTTAGTLDVPRNVVAAWTGTAVLTVQGFDEYGMPMRESSASGTSFTGVKAFARVTRVTVSADVTGLTVGTGNVLGLPIRLIGSAHVIRESQDNAAPTAGTVVAGLAPATVSTATTADVRGTYTPNATPNGTIAYALLIATPDPKDRGNPQFAG